MTVAPSIRRNRTLLDPERPIRERLADLVRARLTDSDAYSEFQKKYYNDPRRFAHDCIQWPKGGGLAAYQADICDLLSANDRLAVVSLHGSGKTCIAAILVHWFMLTRDGQADWKVITTASVERQLVRYLWPEIHKWARRIRWDVVGRGPYTSREALGTIFRLNTGEAFYVVCQDSAAIEGAHAKELFYLFDEAKIIPDSTWDAAEGAFSNAGEDGYEAKWFAISTPDVTDVPMGRFYDIHRGKPGFSDWSTYHITLDQAVDAGRVSRSWAEGRAAAWGEASALYRSKVLGEFTEGAGNSLIPLSWIRAAQERWRAWLAAGSPVPPAGVQYGLDVADGGDDQSILASWFPGLGCTEVRDVTVPDTDGRGTTMKLVGKITPILHASPDCSIAVDGLGVGSGVASRLHEMHEEGRFDRLERVITYKGSMRATDDAGRPIVDRSGISRFANMRSAAFFALRDLLDPEQGSDIILPDDDELAEELTTPAWHETSSGTLAVQPKEAVQQRLGRSPNKADAVAMAQIRVGTSIQVRELVRRRTL